MRSLGWTFSLAAALASLATPAFADLAPESGDAGSAAAAPDAARLRAAAEAFDAGGAAFKRKDYETAATSFEAAYVAVPSAKALRLAIRSHSEAGHGARAATLAAVAQARWADDVPTQKLAGETIEQLEPLLQRVQVTCAPECTLVAGSADAIPGAAAAKWTVYVDPGKPTFRATFVDGRGDASKELVAVAGRTTSLALEAKPKPAPAPVPVPPPPAPAPPPQVEPAAPPPAPAPAPTPAPSAQPAGRGLPKGVFFGGLVATAVLGGVTIWSGVDTLNNPGADAVRLACAGKGETCPEYEAGRAHQTRTNVLLGATLGVAVVTGVLGAFTNWKGSRPATPATSLTVLPSAAPLDRGAALGAVGRF